PGGWQARPRRHRDHRPRPRFDPRGSQRLAIFPRPPARELRTDRAAVRYGPRGEGRAGKADLRDKEPIMATNAAATAVNRRVSLPPSPHRPAPYTGPSREEVLALRRQYLTPGLITYYREPLLVVEGHMEYLWDETGKQYLDGFAGIVSVSVGHCHPS